MKVILNVDAIAPPLTGIGRYALALASGLPAHPGISECRYFAGYRWVADPAAALRAGRRATALRRRLPFKGAALELYFALRQHQFSRRTRKLRDYLLHSPNYLLFEHDGPSVSTVHDLSWRHYPEFHPRDRVRAMEKHMPRTLAQATHVLTDSSFVRQEVIEHFGVAPERVTAVPLGVEPEFRPRTSQECAPMLRRHGLRHGGYLLCVATIEPRKNLERLLLAFSRLPEALQRAYPLVVAGGQGWRMDAIERTAAPLEAAGRLRRLGYVEEAELPLLYAAAAGFAFPSLYEGFGLPPLEAMASGVPVLVSDNPALVEVVREAGLVVPAHDDDAIARGLERLLSDETWRGSAIPAGLAQAQRYTWDRCVAGTAAAYAVANAA